MNRFATVVCALVCATALAQEIGTEIPPGQAQTPPPSSGQPTSYDNPYGQPPATTQPAQPQPGAQPAPAAAAPQAVPGPHKGAFGIRANFNGSGVVAASTSSGTAGSPSATFGFRYLGSDSVAVDFDVGLGLGVGGNFAFGFGAGLGVTAYLGSPEKPIRPLVTGSFLFGKSVSPRTDDFTLGINVGGGAEYWFNDHFSVDGKLLVGLPLNFRDLDAVSFGTFMPGVGANFYF